MKRVKQLKKWGIYELSEKEQSEYGFKFAVIHPETMGTGLVTAKDSDFELNTLEDAIAWVNGYDMGYKTEVKKQETMAQFVGRKMKLRG